MLDSSEMFAGAVRNIGDIRGFPGKRTWWTSMAIPRWVCDKFVGKFLPGSPVFPEVFPPCAEDAAS